jgi:hypothetical protein
MLKANHVPPAATRQFWSPQRKAWAVLLSAFSIFCMLVSVTTYAGYRYATTPRVRTMTALVVQPNAAFLQRSGLVRTEMLERDTVVAIGDRITTSPTSPTGVVARLRIDDSSIALWPGTTMLVEQDESGAARPRLEEGQALIDLPRGGRSLFITGPSLPRQVELTAPGRYRVRRLSNNPPITAIAEQASGTGIEIAAESGTARMGETTIEAGFHLITSGAIRQEHNRWTLIRDGDFSAYDVEEYRATLQVQPNTPHSDTWSVSRQALAQGAQTQSGLFFLRRDCADQNTPEANCRNAARLARLGGNDKDSITGIAQQIAADVSSYRRVLLEADVRIDHQSLSKGGADGTECPLFAQVVYASATQTGLQQWFCFWAFDNGSGAISDLPYITSQKIEPRTWYHFRSDLRARIQDLRVVEQLIFYANGHDYDVSIADVSLVAEGLTYTLGP